MNFHYPKNMTRTAGKIALPVFLSAMLSQEPSPRGGSEIRQTHQLEAEAKRTDSQPAETVALHIQTLGLLNGTAFFRKT